MKVGGAIAVGWRGAPKITTFPPPLIISHPCFLSTSNLHTTVAAKLKQERIRSLANDETTFNDTKIVEEEASYKLDEALQKLGFGTFQFIMLAYAGLGWIAEAMEMMLLSFVGPAIQPEWELSSAQQSFISSITFTGMLIGAYIWGVVSDNYGRKMGFLGASLITTIAGLLSAFAPNYTWLLILRWLIGVGLGCGHVFSSWFLEFVPTSRRGTWMVVFATFWTVGTIIEASLAWSIMPRFGWRWLLGLSTIPSALVLLFYGQVPESPRYLCTKGRLKEAGYILEKGARLNQKQLPQGMLTVSSGHISIINKQQQLTYDPLETKAPSSSSIWMLLSPNLITTTLPLWLLYFGNTFSYYGIVLFTSTISQCSGSAPQMINSSLYTDVFVNSLAELPGLGLAAVIVDKLGRKMSMEIMFIAGFVLLVPLMMNMQNDDITTISLFGTRMFISASFIVACIYAPEVYPTNVRATGVGVATAVGRTGGMVCPLVVAASSCDQTLAVVLLQGMILLSGLSVMLLPLETTGRELVDE